MGRRRAQYRMTVLVLLAVAGCSDGRSVSIQLPSELQELPARVQLRVLDASNGGVCPGTSDEGARVSGGGVLYDENFDATSNTQDVRVVGSLPEGRQYLFIAIARDPEDCRVLAYGCQQVSDADSRVEIITQIDTSGVRCPSGQSCNARGACGSGPPGGPGTADGGSPSGCVPQPGGGECCPVEIETRPEAADQCGVALLFRPSPDGTSCEECGEVNVWSPMFLGSAASTGTRIFPHGRISMAISEEENKSTVWLAARESFGEPVAGVSERVITVWQAPAENMTRSADAAFLVGAPDDPLWEGWEVAFHSFGGLPLMIGWGGPPPAMSSTVTEGSFVIQSLSRVGDSSRSWFLGASMSEPGNTYRVRGGLSIANSELRTGDDVEPRRLVFLNEETPGFANLMDLPIGRSAVGGEARTPIVPSYGMSPWDTRADGELNDKRRIIATEDGVAFWENEGILHFVFPDGRSVEGGQLPVPGISLESLRYDIVSHRSFDGADASAVRRHMLVGPSACGFAAQPIACTASSDSVSCARGVDFSGDLEGGDARENPWTGPAERIALAKITDLTRGVEGQGYAVAWAARGASGGVEVHMGFLRDTGEMVTEPTLLWDAPGYRVVKGLEMAKLWSQRFGYQLAVGVIVEGQNNGDPDEFVLLGATLPVFGC